MDDRISPIVTQEMIDRISNCFSCAEEGTAFVNELIQLSREMCYSMLILNHLEDDKAFELITRNVYDFSRFFRANIEIIHGLVQCVDTEPKS